MVNVDGRNYYTLDEVVRSFDEQNASHMLNWALGGTVCTNGQFVALEKLVLVPQDAFSQFVEKVLSNGESFADYPRGENQL